MHASDFKLIAKEKLRNNGKKAFLISFLYFATFFVMGFIVGLIGENTFLGSLLSLVFSLIEIPIIYGLINSFYSIFKGNDVKPFDFFTHGLSNFGRSWSISLRIILKLIIPIIIILALLIVFSVGVTIFGATNLALNSETSEEAVVSVSSGAIIIYILLLIIAYIATFVWIIPKVYYYQLAHIVAVSNTSLTPKECVEKSKELMTGNRWKLFCLQFSFIGWFLLHFAVLFVLALILVRINPFLYSLISAIVNVVFVLFLLPYVYFSMIAFYEKLTENK